jgi:hypothetical protein
MLPNVLSRLSTYISVKLLLIINVSLSNTGDNWYCNDTIHQPFIDQKKAYYNSVSKEGLYSILIKFGVPMKLVRLIKMLKCIVKVHTGKHLNVNSPIQII